MSKFTQDKQGSTLYWNSDVFVHFRCYQMDATIQKQKYGLWHISGVFFCLLTELLASYKSFVLLTALSYLYGLPSVSSHLVASQWHHIFLPACHFKLVLWHRTYIVHFHHIIWSGRPGFTNELVNLNEFCSYI